MKKKRVSLVVENAHRIIYGRSISEWAPFAVVYGLRHLGLGANMDVREMVPPSAPRRFGGILPAQKRPCVVVEMVCSKGCAHEIFSAEWPGLTVESVMEAADFWDRTEEGVREAIYKEIEPTIRPLLDRVEAMRS